MENPIKYNANIGPRKLVRDNTPDHTKDKPELKYEVISNKDEINRLFEMKVIEELNEIRNSDRKDISEFADLVQVAVSYARMNGFTFEQLFNSIMDKRAQLGTFSNVVLTTLDPSNPSNETYFREHQNDTPCVSSCPIDAQEPHQKLPQ